MKKRVFEIDMVNRKSDTRFGSYSPRCSPTAMAKKRKDSLAKSQSLVSMKTAAVIAPSVRNDTIRKKNNIVLITAVILFTFLS